MYQLQQGIHKFTYNISSKPWKLASTYLYEFTVSAIVGTPSIFLKWEINNVKIYVNISYGFRDLVENITLFIWHLECATCQYKLYNVIYLSEMKKIFGMII
jgi:hypothetical protein